MHFLFHSLSPYRPKTKVVLIHSLCNCKREYTSQFCWVSPPLRCISLNTFWDSWISLSVDGISSWLFSAAVDLWISSSFFYFGEWRIKQNPTYLVSYLKAIRPLARLLLSPLYSSSTAVQLAFWNAKIITWLPLNSFNNTLMLGGCYGLDFVP